MAKKQRGTARTTNRIGAGTPAGQRPAGQRPSGQRPAMPRRVAPPPPPAPRRLSPFAMISIGAVVVGLVIVLVAVLNQPKAVAPDTLLTPGILTPATIASSERTLGDPKAPATVDLYGDFRCSACYYFTMSGAEHQLVTGEVAAGKARIVWHDFLTIDRADKTTASRDAANAAWCAADQGKFWTMHDWLYANQSQTEDASAFTKARLARIGQAAGLDMTTFQPCLDNGTHDAAITAEVSDQPADVTGTPTIIVNGKLVGSQGTVPSYAEIKAAIDAVVGTPASSAPSSAPSSSPAASSSLAASASPSG
jgi:protein-disulfide isomerase